MKNPHIELNATIYDSLNDRYITPVAVSEFFEEILYIGRQIFTRGELERIIRRWR